MCWSADGSLKTYAFAMTIAAIHKYRGILDPALLLFMMVFLQMQLVEYFLWKNLAVAASNQMWSGVGLALILLQPLASAMLLPIEMRNKAWLITLTGTALYLLTTKVNLTTEIGKNGHLKWNWIPPFTSLWTIAWLFMLVAPLWFTGHRLASMFAIITFITSAYFNSKYGTAGSYWCWIAVAGFLLAFLN